MLCSSEYNQAVQLYYYPLIHLITPFPDTSSIPFSIYYCILALYLLEWTTQLLLFSALERCGLYSRVVCMG